MLDSDITAIIYVCVWKCVNVPHSVEIKSFVEGLLMFAGRSLWYVIILTIFIPYNAYYSSLAVAIALMNRSGSLKLGHTQVNAEIWEQHNYAKSDGQIGPLLILYILLSRCYICSMHSVRFPSRYNLAICPRTQIFITFQLLVWRDKDESIVWTMV